MPSNFKFKILAIFFCTFILFVSNSVGAESVNKPFLWKIEGAYPVYLFGTIHLPDPRVTTLHASVEEAFKNSDYVYTEIPLDTKQMLSQVTYLLLEGETTLADLVPEKLLQRADDLLKNINPALTIEPFAKFKIWALATSLPLLEQQLKNSGLPMDAQLYQRAETEGKGVGGLETAQEQFQIFDSLTLEEELKMLDDTIEFMEQANAQGNNIAEEFIKYYRQGDIDLFGAYMMKYIKEDEFSKNFMQKVLYDRNVLMANRIAQQLKKNPSGSYFFAVGAGHFWGDTGIQHLLKAKGLKVEQVE